MQIFSKTAWQRVIHSVMQADRHGLEITALIIKITISSIDHFTVVCLVAWPSNESEAGVDLVLIETSLLLLYKFLLISMRTASLA